MPEVMMVASGLSAIKAALDITKTLADARDASKLLAVKLELQGLLLEAQEAQSTLAREKRELEERVRDLETWDREKERYELKCIAPGVFAFGLKREAEGTEPAHLLCANCFQHRRKSYLQSDGIGILGTEGLQCTPCGAKLTVHHPSERATSRASDPVSWKVV